MSDKRAKNGEIVKRLLARTKSKRIKWSQAGQSGSFATRLDDYVFLISKIISSGALGAFVPPIVLQITRADGKKVASITGGGGAIMAGALSNVNSIDSQLSELYDLVSSDDQDLDKIIGLLD